MCLIKIYPSFGWGDFDLKKDEIKRELIKHIGQEWDSIVAQDITSHESGAEKVNRSLGEAYTAYRLGTVVSTTIFMWSFSGRGRLSAQAGIREIKLSAAHPDFSSTVIDTAVAGLKEKLFYLSDEGLYFTNQPNLNRIILTREENISENDITDLERKLIGAHISKPPRLKTYIWPMFSKDIPDTKELKIAILRKETPDTEFLEKYGERPRVYRNTVMFLCAAESHRDSFHIFLRRLLALKSIEEDKSLKITEGQRKEIKNKIRNQEGRIYEELRKFYRKLFVPARDGFKEIDLSIPTIGESHLDVEIYNRLRDEGELLEKLSPAIIKEKYLKDKDFVTTEGLFENFLKTPGEMRLVSKEALKGGIKEGVEKGLFGFGYVSDKDIKYECLKESPNVKLGENEVIIRPEIYGPKPKPPPKQPLPPEKIEKKHEKYSKLNLKLNVPEGQISTIARILNYLKGRFSRCNVTVNIIADEGEISIQDYEDKIKEALTQAGIKIEHD